MSRRAGLRVLSIGIDSTLLDPEGAGRDTVRRQRLYAERLGELHIVVKSKRGIGRHEKVLQLAHNLWVYPTHSLSRWAFPLDAFRAARKLQREHGFDVVTTQDPFACGLAGAFFRAKTRVPWNCQIHGDFFANPYWLGESALHWIAAPVGLRLALAADTRRVGTEYERRKLIDLGASDRTTYCVPVGLAIPRQATAVSTQNGQGGPVFRYLWLGRFVRQKDLPTLVRALAEVHERVGAGTVELTLAGVGPLRGEVERLIATLGLQDSVRFLGWVAPAGLPALYSGHDALVVSSLYEGTCRVVVEAGVMGLPTVATAFAGALDNILEGETGFVVPVGDVGALAQAMASLACDPGRSRRMGAAAREILSARYDPDELADQYVGMLAATGEAMK